MQKRALAASALWAKVNKDLVDEAWKNKRDPGDRQHLVATMYAALDDDAHSYWEGEVIKHVAALKDNPDAPYV